MLLQTKSHYPKHSGGTKKEKEKKGMTGYATPQSMVLLTGSRAGRSNFGAISGLGSITHSFPLSDFRADFTHLDIITAPAIWSFTALPPDYYGVETLSHSQT
jgi:hypothetical protein